MSRQSLVIKIVVAVTIASLVLTACGGPKTPAAPKVATIIWAEEFDSLNPMYTTMWFSTVTESLWLCWAWEYDVSNQPIPELVTEVPSVKNGDIAADGKTITLKLRKDLKWSDGQPLTSADFRFTWSMANNTHNAVSSSYPYNKVSSLDTPDAYTVVMHFDTPFAPWGGLWRGLLPAHILQPVFDSQGTLDNAAWNRAPTVGCGPYKFDKWESGSYARFVVNDNYWGPRPKIDQIYFRFVPDDAAQVVAMTTGEGDLNAFIPYNDVPTLKNAGIQIVTEPSGTNEGLFFLDDTSGQKGNPALRDVNVRKAIAMSIDREGINKDLLYGLTKVPASYWDSLPMYNNPPLKNYPYDPKAAMALLDQAGWKVGADGVREKGGVKLSLTYGTTIRKIRQDVQAVIQQQLAKVGIKVDISSYEDNTYFANYGTSPAANGQIDIMQWSDGPSNFPDPDIYYWLCSEIPSDAYPAGTNWFFTCDKQLDQLITLQSSQVDPVERQKTISQINQLFYNQVYWLGLWQDPDVWAIGKRLNGVKFSGVTPFFNISEWDLK